MNNQTDNKAYVIGILKEKKIEFKVTTTGRQIAMGHLILIVDTSLGKGEVKVKVMQFADKKDGTPNSLYKGLQTVSQTYKSILEFGEENADTIKIEGQLEDNAYYSANKGDFVESLQIKGTFLNRVDASTPHCCKIGFEGCITSATPIANELEVQIVGIGYEGVAIPVKAMIPENLVGAFQGKYQVGCTALLNIAILNVVEISQVQEEVGFGEGLGETIERHITKRIIFGGSNPKYAGTPGAISEDSVKQGLALRQARLEKRKEDSAKTSGATMDSGFGAAPAGTGFTAPGVGFGMPAGGFSGFPTQK